MYNLLIYTSPNERELILILTNSFQKHDTFS